MPFKLWYDEDGELVPQRIPANVDEDELREDGYVQRVVYSVGEVEELHENSGESEQEVCDDVYCSCASPKEASEVAHLVTKLNDIRGYVTEAKDQLYYAESEF
jgi:hypothetical protein